MIEQNEHTSPKAKAHAREILEAHGYTIERAEGVSESEHETRVLAGYKAALSSEFQNLNNSQNITHLYIRPTRIQ